MSVIRFELLDAQGDATAAGMRNYSIRYRAVTNNDNDHALTVLSSPLMPTRPNSPYFLGNDIDLLAYASKATAKREHGPRVDRRRWIVTIDFQTRPRRQQPQQSNEFTSPLQQPVLVRGEFVDQTIIVDKDLDGEAILNSAGERLPAIEIPAPLFRLQLTKNLAAADVPQWQQYAKRAQNSDQFWGAEAGTVLCSGIKFNVEFWGEGIPYYPTLFDFTFLHPEDNRPDWQQHVIDAGPRYWSGGELGDGKLLHFTDDQGLQYSDGQGYLNGQGGQLLPGGLAEPEKLTFKVKEELPFGALGVPTSNPY